MQDNNNRGSRITPRNALFASIVSSFLFCGCLIVFVVIYVALIISAFAAQKDENRYSTFYSWPLYLAIASLILSLGSLGAVYKRLQIYRGERASEIAMTQIPTTSETTLPVNPPPSYPTTEETPVADNINPPHPNVLHVLPPYPLTPTAPESYYNGIYPTVYSPNVVPNEEMIEQGVVPPTSNLPRQPINYDSKIDAQIYHRQQ
ncbi:hypothetical protein ABK040_004099 [Willaertia magna]